MPCYDLLYFLDRQRKAAAKVVGSNELAAYWGVTNLYVLAIKGVDRRPEFSFLQFFRDLFCIFENRKKGEESWAVLRNVEWRRMLLARITCLTRSHCGDLSTLTHNVAR